MEVDFDYIEELAKNILVHDEWVPGCGMVYPDTIFTMHHEQRQWVASISFLGWWIGTISAAGESADVAMKNLITKLEERQ